MTRETVGKHAFDIMSKPRESHNPIDYQREMHKEYMDEVYKCIDYHKKFFEDDFFVVVLTKRERLMEPVLRNFFLGRRSCPTPTYDQTVFKYHKDLDGLELIWTLPDKETALMFKEHALEVIPEERELRDFVLSFFDGTLDAKTIMLNNEYDVVGD